MNSSRSRRCMFPLWVLFLTPLPLTHGAVQVSVVDRPSPGQAELLYTGNHSPLRPLAFQRLPITCLKPGGWLKRSLELQRDGLAGNLGEISIWLTKNNNAWLNQSGKGDYGWEEVPYWLRGYARIGYVLNDPKLIEESKIWIEATLSSQRDNGDFGPIHNHGKGFRDLWAQMIMLQVLQSYYEYSGDPRVLPFMTRYFRWQTTIPDDQFLEDYWENSRGGDNLASVYWLYNRTGDAFLLELATKIDRNTANWRQPDNLPNWHVVNIAECFRAPATYYLQSGNPADLDATYRNFHLVRERYGQVPGGMFGADENARPGHTDPHQAAETCSFVEQIASDGLLLSFTGDTFWADQADDVAFNSLPAAFLPDYRALRYLTAPNMVISDKENHAPGVANRGPFFLMNPFSSRCCQHNHSSAWVNYAENAWMATPDNGLAAQHYAEGEVRARVGDGTEVWLATQTTYPFEDTLRFKIKTPKTVEFPLYLRVPSWARQTALAINGQPVTAPPKPGGYLKLVNNWKHDDTIEVRFPMSVRVRRWDQNKHSASIDYGPLTFSLEIKERYARLDSAKSAIWDSRWQPEADPEQWPSFEILPESAWNYGLVLNEQDPAASFEVVHRTWPDDHYPFTLDAAPLILMARGKTIPSWTIDENGLCGELPLSPVATDQPATPLTLVPMGCARLRISAFPVVK